MKNLLKRSMAFMLVVCLLLSVVAPTAVAIPVNTADPETGVINYTWALPEGITATNVRPSTAGLTYGNFVDWARTGASFKQFAQYGQIMSFNNSAGQAYVSFAFTVENDGIYDVAIDLQTPTGDQVVNTYIVPVEEFVQGNNNADNNAYVAGLTDPLVLTAESTTVASKTVSKTLYAGDYAVIFSAASATGSHVKFSGLSLTKTGDAPARPVPPTPIEYALEIEADDIGGNGYPTGDGAYGAFTAYAKFSSSMYKPFDNTATGNKDVLQIQASRAAGAWYALKFNVANSGKYDVTLHMGRGAAQKLNVYFVPASALTAASGDAANNEAVAAFENPYVIGDGSSNLGEEELTGVFFPNAGDYLIVFELIETSATQINFSGFTALMVEDTEDAGGSYDLTLNGLKDNTTLADGDEIPDHLVGNNWDLYRSNSYRAYIRSSCVQVNGFTNRFVVAINNGVAGTYDLTINGFYNAGGGVADVYLTTTLPDGGWIKANINAFDPASATLLGRLDTRINPSNLIAEDVELEKGMYYLVFQGVARDDTTTGHFRISGMTVTYTGEIKVETDQDKADAVIALIDAIGTVDDLADEAAIVAARDAYTALTPEQQALVGSKIDVLVAAEAALEDLKNAASSQDQAKADAVIAMIDAIGTVELSDEAAIADARAAYNALNQAQKDLVGSKIDVLVAAEAALEALKNPSTVIEYNYANANVTSNGYPASFGLTYGDFVDYARTGSIYKAYATYIQTQTSFGNGKWFALKFDVAQAGDYDVALRLAKKGTEAVELDVYFVRADDLNKANNDADNQAYIDALTTDTSVKSYRVKLLDNTTWNLTGVQLDQDAYVVIFKNVSDAKGFNLYGLNIDRTGDYTGPAKGELSPEDQAAADAVIAQIAAIGTPVTLNSEAAIIAARQAYDALKPKQQAKVTNYDVLTAAEAALAQLKYDNAVNDVTTKINAIGTVTLDSYAAIKAARDAYNALDDSQKAVISNYAVLTAAEAKLQELRNPNPNDATFDGYVFDFTDAKDILNCTDGRNATFSGQALTDAYTNGTLKFNSLASSSTAYLWNNYTNYPNTIGVHVGGYAGAWLGARFKAPATGSFRFQFYYPAKYHVNLSTKVDAYVIPMSAVTAANADPVAAIESLIASGNYPVVASKNTKTATYSGAIDEDDFWGNVQLTKGEEYAVIFRATENKHGGTDPTVTTSNVWLVISGFSLGNPPTEQDITAAQTVMDKINAIGLVTRDSGADIQAAETAYAALTDKQKELVENYSTLVAARERLDDILDTSDGYEYIYKNKDNITTNNYPSRIGLAYADFVDYARAGSVFKVYPTYIQTQSSFGNGKWFGLMFNVTEAGDYDVALNLAKMGSSAVELDVYFVRADALLRESNNEDNKAFVDGLASDASVKKHHVKLLDNTTWNLTGVQLDQDAYVVIFKNSSDATGFNFYSMTINRTGNYTGPVKEDTSVEDNAAAKVVIDKINAIGTVTLASEEAIKAARNAYNALLPRQQALVTNYDVLTAAEEAFAILKYDNAVADVIGKINAIGTVTLNSYSAINTARDAYNALDAGQKTQVTNYQKLLDAEAKIVELRNPNPNPDTFDGFVYDFTDAMDVLGCTDGKNKEFTADNLDEAYANGTLNFSSLGGNVTPWLWNNYKNFGNTMGVMVQGYAGAWFAVRVKAPETGNYRFQFYYPASYNVNLSTKIDAYMLPMSAINSAVTADKAVDAVIAEMIASGNYAPVASKNVKGATAGNGLDEDDFWGNVQLTKGEEYAVVFRATENKHAGTNPETLTSNVWLMISGMSMATPPSDADIAAAKDVMAKIDAIGIVTANSSADIKAARDAYDKLTEKQQGLVENYNLLLAAEQRLAEILDTTDGIEYLYKDPGNPKLSNGYPSGIGHTYGDFVDYARSNTTAFKPLANNIQTQAGFTNGKWYGLKFDVAQAGDYDVSLNLSQVGTNAVTLDVYFVRADSLIKGNANSKNQEFIDGLATSKDVKTYKVALADKSTWKLTGVQLDKDAYVIIFKNTAGLISEETGKATSTMFNFTGFKALRTGDYTGPAKVIEQPLPDPNTDKFVYDFYYGGAASGTQIFNADLLELMNKEYAMNKQNWIPFAVKVNTVIQNKYSATYLDGTGDRYPWTGLMVSSGVGEWIAVQIKAPGTGTYDLALEHGKNVNGSTTGKVYVIPASALKDASVESIEAAIADDTYKLINSASFRSSNNSTATTELGQAEFEKGKDYIVVIQAAKNKHGGENPFEVNKTTGANELYEAFILANKLTATKFVAPDPLNQKEVIYNFFREDFAYGTNIFSENALGTLMTEYIKGASYWKPYASTIGTLFDVGGATYVNETGKNNKYEAIMVSGYVGEMLGIQIKSPGTGLFNVELTYGLTVNGTSDGEVYFVPLSKLDGDLSNMDKLIESGDYKLQRDVNFKAGYNTNKYKTSLIGQINLEYGEEYVVVFRAASNKHGSAATVQGNGSPYQAYMILQEMKLTKTNTVIDNFEDPEEETPDISGQADPEAAAAVMALIDAIGDEITLASASAITTARTAYDLLTETQKALVTNYQKLVDAEAKLAELVTADDKAKADEVIAKINAIGEVTLEAEGRIVAARIAYTLLTNQQRALVTNYAVLLAAEAKLAELKGADSNSTLDQASADAVAALIDKIGTVTLDSEMYISAARNAYNALTDAQKLLVGNYADLVAAERAFAELKAEQEAAAAEEEAAKRKSQQITIMIVAAVIAAVAAAVVAVFAIPSLRAKVMLLFAKSKKGGKK